MSYRQQVIEAVRRGDRGRWRVRQEEGLYLLDWQDSLGRWYCLHSITVEDYLRG